jgi:glutamyl-tRNA synthetase
VLGHVEVANEALEDLVILRSDGRPTYNFASPIEDWLDGITHVIRGPDHISNTPKQIRILEALGAPVPVHAHVPNVNGVDGRKLSKRHGAVTVNEFRDEGYLPEALVNFLALLGWSYDDRTEIMSRDELVERFTLDRVGASPAAFDYQKLEWMNGVYLRALPTFDLAERLIAYLGEQGSPLASQPERIVEVTPLAQEKIATLAEFEPLCSFLFGPIEIDQEAWERVAGHERAAEILAAAQASLADCEWNVDAIEATLRAVCEELSLKPRVVFGLIRVAVTGTSISPGLFESLHLLGREEALARLAAAAARV